MNVKVSPGHQTEETWKLTSLQPRLKLRSLLVLEEAGIIISVKINPRIWSRYFSNISSHASNFLPEVSGKSRQEKREAD